MFLFNNNNLTILNDLNFFTLYLQNNSNLYIGAQLFFFIFLIIILIIKKIQIQKNIKINKLKINFFNLINIQNFEFVSQFKINNIILINFKYIFFIYIIIMILLIFFYFIKNYYCNESLNNDLIFEKKELDFFDLLYLTYFDYENFTKIIILLKFLCMTTIIFFSLNLFVFNKFNILYNNLSLNYIIFLIPIILFFLINLFQILSDYIYTNFNKYMIIEILIDIFVNFILIILFLLYIIIFYNCYYLNLNDADQIILYINNFELIVKQNYTNTDLLNYLLKLDHYNKIFLSNSNLINEIANVCANHYDCYKMYNEYLININNNIFNILFLNFNFLKIFKNNILKIIIKVGPIIGGPSNAGEPDLDDPNDPKKKT